MKGYLPTTTPAPPWDDKFAVAVSLGNRQANSLVVVAYSLPQQIYGLKESAVATPLDVRQAKSLVVNIGFCHNKFIILPLEETRSRRPTE